MSGIEDGREGICWVVNGDGLHYLSGFLQRLVKVEVFESLRYDSHGFRDVRLRYFVHMLRMTSLEADGGGETEARRG